MLNIILLLKGTLATWYFILGLIDSTLATYWKVLQLIIGLEAGYI
jgi:hypothetical protein